MVAPGTTLARVLLRTSAMTKRARVWAWFRGVARMCRKAISAWIDDRGQTMGAALAYYTVFSIAPLLLIVVSIAGLLFGVDAARAHILEQLRGLMGEEGGRAVQSLLESTNQSGKSILATIVGVVMLLVGATSVFAELQDTLDHIWRAPARDRRSGMWNLVRARFLSFGMILGIGFLMIVSLVTSAMLAAMRATWNPMLGDWTLLASTLNIGVGFGTTTLLFAMIYKIMPRVQIAWRDVWVGAGVTAALFTLGKYLIGLYVGKAGVSSSFGAAGSVVVLLVWVYYSAQIMLIGAEFTWMYAHSYGSRRGCDLGDHRRIDAEAPPSADAAKAEVTIAVVRGEPEAIVDPRQAEHRAAGSTTNRVA